MLISVIIPTRNRPNYIKDLIKDLLLQDIKSDFEIIVVDQSVNPNKLENCNHIIIDSTGPCISRNIGVKNSKGEILVFLDDDARVNNDFIREITAPIIEGYFQAVSGAVCDSKGNYKKTQNFFSNSSDDNFIKELTKNPDTNKSRTCLSFPGGCSAILKDVFNKIGGFDEQFDPTGAGEDRDIALKLFNKGYSTWYNAKARLFHIGATEGGGRDLGSRSLMLDVHTYLMCKNIFSKNISDTLKSFYQSLYKGRFLRTKYRLYQQVKVLLKC